MVPKRNQMRLLFLSSSFPNPLSAARGTFNLSLMQALSAEHDVRVVSPVSWLDALAAGGKRSRLKPRSLGPRLNAVYPWFYYPPKILRSHYGKFLWWSIARTVRNEIRCFQPDAVISYWAHPDGEAAVCAGREAGVPVIAMVGGSDVLLLGRSGPRRKAILDVLHASDKIVPVSQNIADTLLADGLPESKIEVIPRGVDRSVFAPGDQSEARRKLGIADDARLIVAVGRLVPVKGFDMLVDACRMARERVANLRCAILGGGELHGSLLSQIHQAGLDETVQLVGSRKQSELADWYRAADLTVLSSHSEGIPNVLLESLSCGTPFVATRVGGVAEIADERFHTLVPAGNPAALASGIVQRLLAPPPRGVRPRFVPLSWEESAGKLVDVVQEVRGERARLQVFDPDARALIST